MTQATDQSDRARGLAVDLLTALAFLTILPLPRPWRSLTMGSPGRACRAFPLAGALLGLLAGLLLTALLDLGLAAPAAALLAVLALVLLSGGLHEDGLADSADGLAGSDPPARLAIMRDPRIGAFGALALLFSVGLRWAALFVLAQGAAALPALIVAAALSRTVPVVLLFWLPPARPDGLGRTAGRPSEATLLTTLAFAVLLTLPLAGLAAGVLALAAAGVAALLTGELGKRRIGGQTGDVLGAGQQVAEALVLLALAAVQV